MGNDLSGELEAVGNVSERIAGLSPAKRRLLELRLNRDRSAVTSAQSIPRRTETGSASLSFAQQRLWFLDQLEPNSALYNIPKAVRLAGLLNIEALEKSLAAVVERHEALRTMFVSIDGDPAQVIHTSPALELQTIDLSAWSDEHRDIELQRLLQKHARLPFNLASDLMLRAMLVRLAAEEHVLLLVMHHIASDGWSMGVLFRELGALYEAFCDGKPSPLPELPIQYADFAVWQRRHLQGKVLDAQLSYWKNQLAGIPPLLNLAAETLRPSVQRHRGRSQSFLLPKDLSEALKALSRRENVTLYMTLLAAFNVLLYHYTGQDDLVVDSPVAGRDRPEIERLIGFFVNTLVLRTRLSGELTFKELLGRVRKVTLDALAHQDLPFEKLVETLHPKRDAHHRSLVQIAFAFQNVPREPLKLRGLTVTPVRIESESAKLDLTLFMGETEDGLAGSLNYATELFDPPTISRMAEHFHRLLEIVVADPERPLQKLPPFRDEAPSPIVSKFTREAALDHYESSNLTQNQLLIWAGQKLNPEVPLYNVVNTYLIKGEIEPRRFEDAFQTLVSSSDVLRTVIIESNGVPQQTVLTNLKYELEYLDFSKQPNPRAAFQCWANSRSQMPLDLEKCLFDCVLAKIAPREFVWYLNQHHIVTDGRSVVLIFRWMSALYGRSGSRLMQPPIELPPFQDYVSYERDYRRSARYLEAESYWRAKLAEKVEPISFYGKTPRKTTTKVQRITCDVGIRRTQELKRLAFRKDISTKTQNASMFNIFAALLFTYLYRITGNPRHSIGAPFHNRRSKVFKNTLGLFMEVLPLRITIEENDTFVSLIKRIGIEASEGFRFCQTIGNSPTNKVYDVLLNYHTSQFLDFHGIPVEMAWLHTGHENDSLALQVHDFDASGSFVIDFDFYCDVFEHRQRDRAVKHFLRVLDAFLADPEQRLQRVDMLYSEEREQITRNFNETLVAMPRNMTIPRLFEEQAHRRRDQVAIWFERESITYSELNKRSNRLANDLKRLGVGPDTIVGVCAEPSLTFFVGLLGILKAGGAYLGLDPEYPKDRLAFMLQDARVSILLTQKRLLDHHAHVAEVIRETPTGDPKVEGSILFLDEDQSSTEKDSERMPDNRLTSENLAYVVYTSGSTGTAKGVMVQHGGVCNRLVWGRDFYRLNESDRVLQKSSISYDASVWEIFEPLLAGAQLVVARPGGRRDSAYLVELVAERKITVAEFVPSMLGAILDEKGVERCTSFKRVFSGGEALSSEIQERFLNRMSSALYNTYGPTEASIDVTHWECVPDGEQGIVPIGRPIGNTEIYILDRHLNPVPVGVAGELHIAGAGLARGYLNRPELTAEKFLPNPFSAVPGARLYKTGDLARYLPDGNIEFLGRLDYQVKIRGFRIELGEIEAVLREHPNVEQAIVLARGQADRAELAQDKRLIAYIVPRDSMITGHSELREFLRRKLPEYMVPAGFMFLDAIPLTSNGKMDLKALPAPDGDRPQLTESFVAPRSPTEEALAAIWAKLLGLNHVGIRDNFFDLGGHSLLAVRLFAEIEKSFDKRPPLASLFQQATIEHLARLLGQNDSPPTSLVPVQPEGSKVPFFCVHEFFGDVFCYMNLARHLGQDQPFYALEPRGLDGVEEPFETVEAMAAHYIDTVRTVQPRGPYALGGLCFGGVIAFEMAQQLRAKGESVCLVALLDSGVGLNYGRIKWWRAFFQNFPRDFPSWLAGSLQLTRAQWLDVIRIKTAAAKGRLGGLFCLPSGVCQPNDDPAGLKRLGDVFRFSERHYRVARAQYRALKRYQPQMYTGRLTLFRARMQPFFSSHDPQKGWSRLAGGGVEVKNIPGNHLAMLQEPHVKVLAEELRACLERNA
jgi:amino acid adenylation domain-containing protein